MIPNSILTESLLIRFAISLERHELESDEHHGPRFHRWLPDGEQHALTINNDLAGFVLKVWFEQWGFMDNSWITFAYKRKEVDSAIVPRQAVLDAGPLYGSLRMNVPSDELNAIKENREGDPAYEALGKRIVKEVIQDHVLRFLRIIRFTFGQYWVDLPDNWDSTQVSLGYYCHGWGMKWSLDNGVTWSDFVPNKKTRAPLKIMLHGAVGKDLIHQSDWESLRSIVNSGYDPPFTATLISSAHELADQGRWQHAFISGVTALEVAIQAFYRERVAHQKAIQDSLQPFWKMPLPARLTAVSLVLQASAGISAQDIQASLQAIEIRDEIVHEGLDPKERDEGILRALLRVASALLPGPRLRFPPMHSGNALL